MLKGRILALLSILLMFAAAAHAQESGQIAGTVQDQSGAVVAGTKITISESATGLSRTITSGADGNYVIPNLRPTTYILTAEAQGFQSYRQAGITLLANQSLTANISMSVGAVTETVNVSGQVVQ